MSTKNIIYAFKNGFLSFSVVLTLHRRWSGEPEGGWWCRSLAARNSRLTCVLLSFCPWTHRSFLPWRPPLLSPLAGLLRTRCLYNLRGSIRFLRESRKQTRGTTQLYGSMLYMWVYTTQPCAHIPKGNDCVSVPLWLPLSSNRHAQNESFHELVNW